MSRPVDQTGARARVVERIHRFGPISFAEYMDLALYGEGGFYATGARPGRTGHFLTSPEVGPLFAEVVARALDSWWERLGSPDPFVVVEAGAGTGTLAAGVRAARPSCSPALRYVLVERSPALRAGQEQRLPLEPPSAVLGAAGGPDDEEDAGPTGGTGPVFTSLAELPGASFVGVVLANELLDNLPVLLLERQEGPWAEVRVGEEGGRLVEVLVPAADDLAREADRLAPGARPGGRIPLQRAARSWLGAALRVVGEGAVVVLDYAGTTPSMAERPWNEWLRTYSGHGRGRHPLDDPGAQDVTCEVAADQLAAVRRSTPDRSQVEFLEAHGLGELAEGARATWRERAHLGDLQAVRARSRLAEAAALTDAAGLGAFRAIEWEVPERTLPRR